MSRSDRKVIRRSVADFPPPTPLDTPCRLWQGSLNNTGYGRKWVIGRGMILMHRWVMEQIVGRRLDPFEVVMHRCDHPPCYRADHLVLGTKKDNTSDMSSKGRHAGRFQPGHGRLSPEQVATIRSDTRTTRAIAPDYGVHHVTIHRIKTGALYPWAL